MSLQSEAEQIVLDVFGPSSAKKVATLGDSVNDPNGFLDACVQFVARMLGPNVAQQKFQNLTDKYGG